MLIARNTKLEPGTLFTIYYDFYGKGLPKYSRVREIPKDAMAELHNKLKYADDTRLRILYNPKNLTCDSAWNRLGGRTRLFCFCYIEKSNQNEIVARPYIIGDLHTGLELQTPSTWNGRNYGEIHVSEIDQFVKIREQFESEKKAPEIRGVLEILCHFSKIHLKGMTHDSRI